MLAFVECLVQLGTSLINLLKTAINAAFAIHRSIVNINKKNIVKLIFLEIILIAASALIILPIIILFVISPQL